MMPWLVYEEQMRHAQEYIDAQRQDAPIVNGISIQAATLTVTRRNMARFRQTPSEFQNRTALPRESTRIRQ